MSAKLPVKLEAQLMFAEDPPPASTVEFVPGGIRTNGTLSAGGRGWRLTASAVKHRRQIHAYVFARKEEDGPTAELEEFRYALEVRGLSGGAYGFRVTHVFIDAQDRGIDGSARITAMDRAVHVPPPAADGITAGAE